jgi:hypothetical protein
VIRRLLKNLGLREGDVPDASVHLEREGWALLPGVLDAHTVAWLREEIDEVFDSYPPERLRSDKEHYRYEMCNRSAACQEAIGHPRILEVIEPLLAEDCHVIANTAWRNPPDHEGGPWHCDAGPHAGGAHLSGPAAPRAAAPTAVVPGSHRSGRLPSFDRLFDDDLTYDGRPPVVIEASAGDVALFVSDVWHRGMPAGPAGRGRLFLQVHYGRRDIAQRLRTTDVANQLSPEAIERAKTERARTLVGLHDAFFYDA